MRINGNVVMAVGSGIASLLIAFSEVAAAAPGLEGLTLQITSTQDAIYPMEPICLTITLGNESQQPVLAHDMIEPNTGYVSFYVAGEDGRFHLHESGNSPVVSGDANMRELPPGYKRSVRTHLWHGTTANSPFRSLFPAPGQYVLKAKFASIDGGSKIESNIVKVRVVEPEARDEEAWRYLKNHELENHYTLFGSTDDPKKIGKIEDFMERFPDSRYAVYGHYSLGLAYYVTKHLDRAGVSLEKAAGRQDFCLRDEVLYSLVRICIRKGEVGKARQYLRDLEEAYPNSAMTGSAGHDIEKATRP